MSDHESLFRERYGKWALILGASDGLGAALAEAAAQRGLNCILVARRAQKLDALARQLRHNHNVDVKALALDLTSSNAKDTLVGLIGEFDIGSVFLNAGGDTLGTRLVDADPDAIDALISRNVLLLTHLARLFSKHFIDRDRGGLAVIGSDSALNGAGRISVYSATKAYALNLIESLWAELQHTGVDATYFVIGTTDTPKLRSLLTARSVAPDAVSLAEPDMLAHWVMDNLPNGPTQVFDVSPDSMDPLTSPQARRARVARNTDIIDFFFGDLSPDPTLLASLKSGRSWK